ncbi:hypothetical protein JQ561_32560 [Bradyrhizobium diazoefficiens]|uniref:hypothetical protein n=1 Tax=Bradyrhizobium sp. WYCCWR 12699 TaxID=3064203 RepID=UPI001BA65B9E|nr:MULTISPECIES: hypothetical protein [Bradyrhizobium]MBR0931365.1 hypothetical protein [Bradyrhizobium diazoefficiens]MDT4737664.1 hypothetical protein [Bradyrhizobium sp. WYCCWR 12699]
MTKFVIAALLAMLHAMAPVAAQTSEAQPKPPVTDREQVQADRAKAAAEEKSAPTTRPWDRDANGKRPWERSSVTK